MTCSISKIENKNGVWTFTYIDEKGNTRVIEEEDKEQCEVLRAELVDAFNRDDEYRFSDDKGSECTLFEKIPKAKAKFNSLPSEDDPDFFLKILRRFARKIAIDPTNRELIAASSAISRLATAARGWQDYANLIAEMNEFKSFMENYYKAQRVGSSVIRSPSGDQKVPTLH